MTCEGDARLLVVDLRTMRCDGDASDGDDPDVLARDPVGGDCTSGAKPALCRASGVDGATLASARRVPRAARAQSVSVDPATHRVYVPLENVGGHPVLRILAPAR